MNCYYTTAGLSALHTPAVGKVHLPISPLFSLQPSSIPIVPAKQSTPTPNLRGILILVHCHEPLMNKTTRTSTNWCTSSHATIRHQTRLEKLHNSHAVKPRHRTLCREAVTQFHCFLLRDREESSQMCRTAGWSCVYPNILPHSHVSM